MIEELELIPLNGGDDGRGIVIVGSDRCEFFHAAIELMKELKVGCRYTILDRLELEQMQRVVRHLKGKYAKDVICPFIFAGDGTALSGFNREVWIEYLGNL